MAALALVHGPLGSNCLHLCVDMQRLFAPGGPWAVPWAEKVLPPIEELVALHPERTVFTRFIPAARPGEGPGAWSRYYSRWAEVTLTNIDGELVELMPTLAASHRPQEFSTSMSIRRGPRVVSTRCLPAQGSTP